jgi:acyl dehydratase
MPKLYFETLEEGDSVVPVTKPPVTRVQIAKFAGASREYSPLHIDDDFAKSAGYGGVFAHGGIALGFAIEAIEKWLENGRVVAVRNARFKRLVWPGDILTAKGVIVRSYENDDGEPRIDVDVWAENQNRDVVMTGEVVCSLWRNEKEEKRTKALWPPSKPKTLQRLRSARAAAEKKAAAEAEAAALAEKEAAKAAKKAARDAEKAKKKAAADKVKAKAKKEAEKAKKAAAKKKAKKAPARKKSNAKKKPAPKKKAAAKKKAPARKKSNAKKKAKKKR